MIRGHRPDLRQQARGRRSAIRVFEVIRAGARAPYERCGHRPVRWPANVSQAWADQKWCAKFMSSCTCHGVGTARAVAHLQDVWNDAVLVIAENPYRWRRDHPRHGLPQPLMRSPQGMGMSPRHGSACGPAFNYALLEAKC